MNIPRILIETSKVGDIPIQTMKEQGVEQCSLVFFIHGFTSNKREGLAFGNELSLRGFCFYTHHETVLYLPCT